LFVLRAAGRKKKVKKEKNSFVSFLFLFRFLLRLPPPFSFSSILPSFFFRFRSSRVLFLDHHPLSTYKIVSLSFFILGLGFQSLVRQHWERKKETQIENLLFRHLPDPLFLSPLSLLITTSRQTLLFFSIDRIFFFSNKGSTTSPFSKKKDTQEKKQKWS